MHDSILPYGLPLLLGAGLSAMLAVIAWYRRPAPGAAAFVALALCLSEWCLAYALALCVTEPFWQITLSKLRYVGVSALCGLWLVLALQYTGRQHLLTRPRIAALLAVPLLTQVLTWYPSCHLMFDHPTVGAPPPFTNVAFDYGPWFWVFVAVSYSQLVTGMILLVSWSSRRGADYRGQTCLLILAALAPFAANIATELRILPNRDLDLTPFFFLFSSAAMMLAIFRFRLLRLVPVAYDAVLKQMQDGVLVVDSGAVIVDLNPAAERIVGLPHGRATGQHLSAVLPQWPTLWEQIGAGQSLREEASLSAGGDERWFEVTGTPLAEPGSGQQGYLVVLRDISGRKRGQRAIVANELRYRTLFETSMDAIFLETLEGRILDANVAACQQYGYSLDEIRQLTVAELVPPEVAGDLGSIVTQELSAGGLHLETLGRRRNGEVFPTEVNTRLVHLGDEDLIVAYVRDITDRIRAEEHWRWSDTLLRSLANNSPLAFYMVDDRDDRVLFINQRFCQLWEAPELEQACEEGPLPSGSQVTEAVVARVTQADGFRRLWQQLRGEIPRTVVEQDLTLHDGRALRWVSTQVRDAEGRYLGRLHIFADTTDRKRAEDAQRLAAVGQLAAGVAHEFNNLLCSMRLRADLAEIKGDTRTYEELARVVIEGAVRGAQVCDDLLSFSRPRTLSREPQSIEVPIEAALSLAEPQLAAADVTVEREYKAGDHLVDIDTGQIEQVCLNLILNACHAMPGGGTLRIRTAYDPLAGGQVVAQVSDTGTGIRPEDLPRIFEPFFTTKGRLGGGEILGTGLGLSVSHGLLQAHGARITVQSEWGHGATFEMRFREWREAPRHRATEAISLADAVGQARPARVLLAEDEAPVRETIAEALRLRGCEVVSVGAVPEALEALGEQAVDLLVTDLLMPHGNGLELVGAASQLIPPPLILVMTGKVSSTLEQDLRLAGATRWLLKPFGMPTLMRVVDELLQQLPPSN